MGGDTVAVAAAWRSWLEASYSPATTKVYWNALRLFFFSDHPVSLESATQRDVTEFLRRFPYRSNTRRTYYEALRNFFDYAVATNALLVSPVQGIRVPTVVEKVPRALSEAEMMLLVDAAMKRSRRRGLAILILYYTAARLNEAVNMEWRDIEGENLILRVTKGGKERKVPISPALQAVLAEQHDFTGHRERIIDRTGTTVWGWVRDAGRAAGLERVHPHLLRSSFATQALVKGAKPHTIQNLLGHVNIRTTMRYWAVTDEDRKDAANLVQLPASPHPKAAN